MPLACSSTPSNALNGLSPNNMNEIASVSMCCAKGPILDPNMPIDLELSARVRKCSPSTFMYDIAKSNALGKPNIDDCNSSKPSDAKNKPE